MPRQVSSCLRNYPRRAPPHSRTWGRMGTCRFFLLCALTLSNHTLPSCTCRSSKYRFCFPGDSNTIPDDTKLGSYIASIGKVGLFCIWHGITVILPVCRMLKHSKTRKKIRRLRDSHCPTDQTLRSDLRRCRCQRETHLRPSQPHYPTDNLGKGTRRHVRAWLECRYVE